MVRIRIIAFCFVVLFFVVWAKLFYWQVLSAEDLRKKAESQHFYRLEIPAIRGQILSVDGSPLVTNRPAYLVFAEKNKLQEEETLAKKIAKILDIDEASVSAKLEQDNVWIPLKHKVDEEKVRELKSLQITGLGFEREDKRYYPEASMSGHILGFVGKSDLGEDKGYFGLEGYYDKELGGQNGYLQQEKDAFGNPILIGESERIDAQNGRSILLYLDKTIQFIAEEKLKEGLEKYKAKSGNVVIVDPGTGGILAFASYPNYDPVHYWDFPKEYFKNPIIAETYEPGSTFKVLIMAKAIDEGKVKAKDTFQETGPVSVADYTIRTWNNKYHGEITMTEILEHSSNVGMVHVADLLGKEKTLEAVRDFGFGEKTNIDLQDEAEAQLRPSSEWQPIDLATVSFGQGIAVTPVQMTMAVGALANNGYLMKPQAAKKIITDNGEIIDIKPKEVRRVVKSSTAKVITEMMVSAVENGVAKWAKPKGFRIAGKSGTAQIPVQGHYDEEKTIGSFVGFAPADKPKFVMLVTLREPESSPWGAGTAAPLFFEIAEELFTYYGITPE